MSLRRPFAFLVGLFFAVFGVQAQAQSTSPSTAVTPYLTSHLPGVQIESILTVDDGTVPKTGGGVTRMVGIPDGIGVIDGAELSPPDPNYFLLLVNHELNSTQGVVRDHGNVGAFISKWKVDKTTHEVVEGDDLIKQVFDWDEGTQSYAAASVTFDRFCSSDRPPPTAIFNSASGLGSQEILHTGGEESSNGRAFGHVVTGPDAGNSYELEHLGFAAFENVLLNPAEQDLTIAGMLDDDENGEVYFYVGTKQASGNEVEKAGLVGGDLYALAVEGKPYELDDNLALALGEVEPFTLKLIGTDGDRPVDAADVEARGADTSTPVDPSQDFESLKLGGPEDGTWDKRPGFENNFYFATKGTTSNGLNAPTRLWRLEFADIASPESGGTLTLLSDGPQNRLGSLDNMTFEVISGQPKLFLQEDLGGDPRLGKIYDYDLATGLFEEIAQHDPERFFDGGVDFLTTNEESSGIVSLANVLGQGWFASSVQVHTSAGLSDSAELVEHGQLLLLNVAGRGSDVLRERVVSSGDVWDYRVDGVDPGPDWNSQDFVIDASWNTTTDGTPTGPQPTMLGYGEAAGTFAADLVQPPSPRAASYYFRRNFDLPSDVALLDLYMKVDDGAVVYINGVEVARYNMGLDLTVDNDTFASANEPAERDWKHVPITAASVPLDPTGNVIAVSVHQENSGSSDLRLDLQLIAWGVSPDAGTAPATPQNPMVGDATESQLALSWDGQADAKFFRIERQVDGDVAWEVVEPEYPGSFASYTDTDVEQGTTYNYRLVAVNVHGQSVPSAVASGTTLESLVPVIFEEHFEVPDSLGQFTAVDVAEPGIGYSWVLWDFSTTGAAQGNNFGSGLGPTEDWLITTDPINFAFFRNEVLKYDSQISFSGPAPQVLYSTDYDPAVHADPNDATWTLINEDTSTFGVLTPVGPFELSSIDDTAYLAFKYTGNGGASGESVRFTIDDVIIEGECGFDFEGGENAAIEADPDSPWTVVNLSSAFGWLYDTYAGQQGAVNNNFGSDPGGVSGGTEADDWLISPAFTVSEANTAIEFMYYENFGDTLGQPLSVVATTNFTGDPLTTAWVDITPAGLNGSTADAWIPAKSQPLGLTGNAVRVAFRYQSAGNGGGTTKRIGVDQICVAKQAGPLEADFSFTRNGGLVSFVPTVTGGVPPYVLEWDFGDGVGESNQAPTHDYAEEGSYTVTLSVTDAEGTQVVVQQAEAILVTGFDVPDAVGDLRIATFNTSMNRPTSGGLAEAMAAGDDPQIMQVAEVIQRVNPDVVFLNEYDQLYDEDGQFDRAATEATIEDFIENYLGVAQATDTGPVDYPYFFVAAVNTGVPTGFDLNNDGDTTDPEDAYGFGEFPGQYGMVLLSKERINEHDVRTFQKFRWVDMPGALLPPDPQDSDGDGDLTSYYNEDELQIFRLSSKSHWDVPIEVRGVGTIHFLMSHPTPPVFDDGTAGLNEDVADWNGLRNHDEIRFWADYVDPHESGYIYDDVAWEKAVKKGRPAKAQGGLERGARFVILGDENADPVDGDASFNPVDLLLSSPLIDTSITPTSAGALEQVPTGENRETKTASFLLRADYVLPSESGWNYLQGWVFWPETTDLEAGLLSASDHRMVVVDLEGAPKSRKKHKRRFPRFALRPKAPPWGNRWHGAIW